MFRAISRRNLILVIPNHNQNPNAHRIEESITNTLRLLQTLALESTPNTTNPPNQDNPTVSYLTNKCGLPLDSAISASKKVTIASIPKADSVLQLLKSYDFTQPHITNLITKCPSLIQSDSLKTLKPKFEFCESLGLSKPHIAKFVSSNASFLQTSLPNQIIPTVNFLRTTLSTNEAVVLTLKRWPSVVYQNYRTNIEPNILTLRAHGARDSDICRLFMKQPRAFMVRNELFEERVRKVEELGIGSESLAYFRCIRAVMSLSDTLWKKKVDVFKSFGWSDEDVIAAFKTQPNLMCCSEKKIVKLMDFYLDKLGLKPSDVAKCPNLLLLSLEKRIIPRVSVLQILLAKSLVNNDLNVASALNSMKDAFEKKFVFKYQNIVPEIASVYKVKSGKAFEGMDLMPGLDLRTSVIDERAVSEKAKLV